MATVTPQVRDEVREIAYHFFAEECEVDRSKLNDDTNIVEDIGGDSLMSLELIETFRKKFALNTDLKSIGQYMLEHRVDTIGKMVAFILYAIEREGDLSAKG